MKSNNFLKSAALGSAAALLLLCAASSVSAAEENGRVGKTSGERGDSSSPASVSGSPDGFFERLWTPGRKSVAIALASSYDPNFNISSITGTAAAIYDHGYLWDRVNSGNTSFKLEAVAGSMIRPENRALVSGNLMAMYYPQLQFSGDLRPYLEAGIGVIYTDYRVHGQAYRLIFAPQVGIGTEIKGEGGSSFFIAMRLHHISNGRTNRDNQGINSLLLQLGRYY